MAILGLDIITNYCEESTDNLDAHALNYMYSIM